MTFLKLNKEIILVILLGAVINGGFYTFQRIYYDRQLTTALNSWAYDSNIQRVFLLPTADVNLFVPESDSLNFLVPKEITDSWTETFFRQYSKREEIRLSSKNLYEYLKSMEKDINKEPINAKLEFKNNKAVAFSLAQNGTVLDIDKSIDQIFQNIKNNHNNIALIINHLEPSITADKINNFGITELLAKGESDFSGSTATRIHNINTGSGIISGTLLKPGEEFSFNNILGKVDGDSGYKPELVIKNSKLILEFGGGICQVSTTVFRAAILAGLPIVERHAHSLPVRYYNPQGFDATIYPGVSDLRFKNDTSAYLLIQNRVEKNKLFVEIYGSADNRKVEISGPKQYDVKLDGSLKAVLSRIVIMPDGTKNEDKFYSNYRSPSLFPREKNPLE